MATEVEDQPQQAEPSGPATLEEALALIEAERAEKKKLAASSARASGEAKGFREQLEAERAEKKKLAAAKATDAEREQQAEAERREKDERLSTLERRAADAEAALVAKDVDMEIVDRATKAKFKYPKAALKLIERAGIAAEDGAITGVEAAIQKLVKDYPELVDKKPDGGTPPPRPPHGGRPSQAPDPVASFLDRKTSLGT